MQNKSNLCYKMVNTNRGKSEKTKQKKPRKVRTKKPTLIQKRDKLLTC